MKNLTKLTALTLTAALALTACGSSAATTELSTPPLRARSTFLSPTWARRAATCSSIKACASSGVLMRAMLSGRLLVSMRTLSFRRLILWHIIAYRARMRQCLRGFLSKKSAEAGEICRCPRAGGVLQ